MYSDNVLAFVDETGDPGLNTEKSTAPPYFIVTAVLTNNHDVGALRHQCDDIRREHFGESQIKSRNVGGDHARRLQILQQVAKLQFKAYILIVDKRLIRKESGLRFKSSFVKYLHSKLDSKLFAEFRGTQVVADSYGTERFMEGFKKYVLERHKPDLFAETQFAFASAKSEVLIQVADFVGGTVYQLAKPQLPPVYRKAFYEALAPHLVGLVAWPPSFRRSYEFTPQLPLEGAFDRAIEEASFARAERFLSEFGNADDPVLRRQVACVEFLLFYAEMKSTEEYVPTSELRQIVSDPSSLIDEQEFRSSVIAGLRDAGLLIASSKDGYKLPTCVNDCHQFASRYVNQIEPMLFRLRSFRDHIRSATDGVVDPISPFPKMREILSQLQRIELETAVGGSTGSDADTDGK